MNSLETPCDSPLKRLLLHLDSSSASTDENTAQDNDNEERICPWIAVKINDQMRSSQ